MLLLLFCLRLRVGWYTWFLSYYAREGPDAQSEDIGLRPGVRGPLLSIGFQVYSLDLILFPKWDVSSAELHGGEGGTLQANLSFLLPSLFLSWTSNIGTFPDPLGAYVHDRLMDHCLYWCLQRR